MERKRLNTPGAPSTILNDELIAQFCKLTKQGLPADGVCDYLCIASSTFWTWIRKGERYLMGNNDPPEDHIYGDFVRQYKRATAEYRLKIIKRLHNGNAGVWVRDMAILERRDKKSFSRDMQDGGDDSVLDVDEKFL